MNKKQVLGAVTGGGMIGVVALTSGCSGSTEDVRVTFCKDLTRSLLTPSDPIEWTGGENTFVRPAYAVTGLTFSIGNGAAARTGESACHYEYEALDDTAVNLADPLQAYATLPFAMALDGRMLSDQELVAAVRSEQKRKALALMSGLEQGARDLAAKVRAGTGQ